MRPDDAVKFEAMAAALQPEASAYCKEFMRHKTFMFSPSKLRFVGTVIWLLSSPFLFSPLLSSPPQT